VLCPARLLFFVAEALRVFAGCGKIDRGKWCRRGRGAGRKTGGHDAKNEGGGRRHGGQRTHGVGAGREYNAKWSSSKKRTARQRKGKIGGGRRVPQLRGGRSAHRTRPAGRRGGGHRYGGPEGEEIWRRGGEGKLITASHKPRALAPSEGEERKGGGKKR